MGTWALISVAPKVANNAFHRHNHYVEQHNPTSTGDGFPPGEGGIIREGSIILITLLSPREKFWSVLLAINTAGVFARGVPLESFDDVISQIRAREPVEASSVFFPLHRVERVELDLPGGNVPSLSERFEQKTGLTPAQFFRGEVSR